MSNMSYCRFENTDHDLAECQRALEQQLAGGVEPLSRSENLAAHNLLARCMDIIRLVGDSAGLDLLSDGTEHQLMRELTGCLASVQMDEPEPITGTGGAYGN